MGAGKLSILLTGDVEGEGEQQLTQELQTLKTLQEAKTLRVAQESQALQNARKLQESQEPREQQELWESRRQGGFKVDILKVAHHAQAIPPVLSFLPPPAPLPPLSPVVVTIPMAIPMPRRYSAWKMLRSPGTSPPTMEP